MFGRKGIPDDSPCGVLFRALERARTLFAIAVATESKTTAPEKWSYYLETEDQMRRVLKDMRSQRWSAMTWSQAIEVLRRLPNPYDQEADYTEAQVLCRQLRDVMARLESRNCENDDK